ncbi:hypothetical protein V1514DRAFT_331988 [Lipomyces japonicus]|uniref:uncharacterized protein n=1 Tax=Lipomyces japonicus TaxID=56871 RepID=UPI0034CECE8A
MVNNASSAHRACDGCYVRKIRCDGENENSSCGPCQRAKISCTYTHVRKIGGPRRPKQKTLKAIADTSRAITVVSPPPSLLLSSSSSSSSSSSTIIDLEQLKPIIDAYGEKLKLVWPVVDITMLYARLSDPYPTNEIYALVTAIAAATISQLHLPESAPVTANHLVSEVMRAKALMPVVTVNTILTSYFLHTYFSNERNNSSAFMSLREAVSGLHALGLHREDTYLMMTPGQEQRMRKLYYMMIVTERGYSLQYEMPVILEPSIGLPSLDGIQDQNERVFMTGFLNLIHLFLKPDKNTIDTWKRPDHACMENIQRTVEQVMQINPLLLAHESQKVDIFVTQRWMQILTWQLAVLKGNGNVSIDFPASAVKNIMEIGMTVDIEAFEAHGPEMKFKLYEISSALADVVLCSPQASHDRNPIISTSRDLLHHFILFISSLKSTEPRARDRIFGKLLKAVNSHSVSNDFLLAYDECYENNHRETVRVMQLLDSI